MAANPSRTDAKVEGVGSSMENPFPIDEMGQALLSCFPVVRV
ncbi:hypothetical protein RISK_004749 [Rhodopirellula islandica]|uniref:Uncharacterized protein n=1 Tax=Rhodopirellula islandica TaxID=595434 RepID=A0A0J1B9P5_RHOIS|nr:hypothetical protein RISK_004749 [Rhodopirellula islandica]